MLRPGGGCVTAAEGGGAGAGVGGGIWIGGAGVLVLVNVPEDSDPLERFRLAIASQASVQRSAAIRALLLALFDGDHADQAALSAYRSGRASTTDAAHEGLKILATVARDDDDSAIRSLAVAAVPYVAYAALRSAGREKGRQYETSVKQMAIPLLDEILHKGELEEDLACGEVVEAASRALVVIAQLAVPVHDYRDVILRIPLGMAHHPTSASCRARAVQLLGALSGLMGPGLCAQFLIPQLLCLCEDLFPEVRAEVAVALSLISRILPRTAAIGRKLYAPFLHLLTDADLNVRIRAFESLPNIARMVPLEAVQLQIVPLLRDALKMQNLKHTARKVLAPFMCGLASPDLVPRDFMETFCSLPSLAEESSHMALDMFSNFRSIFHTPEVPLFPPAPVGREKAQGGYLTLPAAEPEATASSPLGAAAVTTHADAATDVESEEDAPRSTSRTVVDLVRLSWAASGSSPCFCGSSAGADEPAVNFAYNLAAVLLVVADRQSDLEDLYAFAGEQRSAFCSVCGAKDASAGSCCSAWCDRCTARDADVSQSDAHFEDSSTTGCFEDSVGDDNQSCGGSREHAETAPPKNEAEDRCTAVIEEAVGGDAVGSGHRLAEVICDKDSNDVLGETQDLPKSGSSDGSEPERVGGAGLPGDNAAAADAPVGANVTSHSAAKEKKLVDEIGSEADAETFQITNGSSGAAALESILPSDATLDAAKHRASSFDVNDNAVLASAGDRSPQGDGSLATVDNTALPEGPHELAPPRIEGFLSGVEETTGASLLSGVSETAEPARGSHGTATRPIGSRCDSENLSGEIARADTEAVIQDVPFPSQGSTVTPAAVAATPDREPFSKRTRPGGASGEILDPRLEDSFKTDSADRSPRMRDEESIADSTDRSLRALDENGEDMSIGQRVVILEDVLPEGQESHSKNASAEKGSRESPDGRQAGVLEGEGGAAESSPASDDGGNGERRKRVGNDVESGSSFGRPDTAASIEAVVGSDDTKDSEKAFAEDSGSNDDDESRVGVQKFALPRCKGSAGESCSCKSGCGQSSTCGDATSPVEVDRSNSARPHCNETPSLDQPLAAIADCKGSCDAAVDHAPGSDSESEAPADSRPLVGAGLKNGPHQARAATLRPEAADRAGGATWPEVALRELDGAAAAESAAPGTAALDTAKTSGVLREGAPWRGPHLGWWPACFNCVPMLPHRCAGAAVGSGGGDMQDAAVAVDGALEAAACLNSPSSSPRCAAPPASTSASAAPDAAPPVAAIGGLDTWWPQVFYPSVLTLQSTRRKCSAAANPGLQLARRSLAASLPVIAEILLPGPRSPCSSTPGELRRTAAPPPPVVGAPVAQKSSGARREIRAPRGAELLASDSLERLFTTSMSREYYSSKEVILLPRISESVLPTGSAKHEAAATPASAAGHPGRPQLEQMLFAIVQNFLHPDEADDVVRTTIRALRSLLPKFGGLYQRAILHALRDLAQESVGNAPPPDEFGSPGRRASASPTGAAATAGAAAGSSTGSGILNKLRWFSILPLRSKDGDGTQTRGLGRRNWRVRLAIARNLGAIMDATEAQSDFDAILLPLFHELLSDPIFAVREGVATKRNVGSLFQRAAPALMLFFRNGGSAEPLSGCGLRSSSCATPDARGSSGGSARLRLRTKPARLLQREFDKLPAQLRTSLQSVVTPKSTATDTAASLSEDVGSRCGAFASDRQTVDSEKNRACGGRRSQAPTADASGGKDAKIAANFGTERSGDSAHAGAPGARGAAAGDPFAARNPDDTLVMRYPNFKHEAIIIRGLVHKYANHSSHQRRQTFISLCDAILSSTAVPVGLFEAFFKNPLMLLLRDRVCGVRTHCTAVWGKHFERWKQEQPWSTSGGGATVVEEGEEPCGHQNQGAPPSPCDKATTANASVFLRRLATPESAPDSGRKNAPRPDEFGTDISSPARCLSPAAATTANSVSGEFGTNAVGAEDVSLTSNEGFDRFGFARSESAGAMSLPEPIEDSETSRLPKPAAQPSAVPDAASLPIRSRQLGGGTGERPSEGGGDISAVIRVVSPCGRLDLKNGGSLHSEVHDSRILFGRPQSIPLPGPSGALEGTAEVDGGVDGEERCDIPLDPLVVADIGVVPALPRESACSLSPEIRASVGRGRSSRSASVEPFLFPRRRPGSARITTRQRGYSAPSSPATPPVRPQKDSEGESPHASIKAPCYTTVATANNSRSPSPPRYMMGGFLSESILETHGPRKVENLLVYPAVGAVIAALYSCRSRHSPKKARNVITVSIYLAAFAGIWKSGVTFGLACVKFGRSFRLRRMDNRATLIRASLAGSCMVIGTIIITMADFAARDAAYVALIYSAVLAGVDAYGHKKWWQPRWWLPNSVLASIMITLGMLIVLLNEHALERGDQLRLPDAAELAGIKTSESSQTPSDGT